MFDSFVNCCRTLASNYFDAFVITSFARTIPFGSFLFFFFYVSFISTGSFSLINLSIRQRWHQSRSHPFFFFLDEMKRFSLCQDFGFFIRRRLHRVIISGDGIWPKWNVDWNRWISRGNANSRNYAYASGADDFITARNRSYDTEQPIMCAETVTWGAISPIVCLATS